LGYFGCPAAATFPARGRGKSIDIHRKERLEYESISVKRQRQEKWEHGNSFEASIDGG
jgi:hypothetical protein